VSRNVLVALAVVGSLLLAGCAGDPVGTSPTTTPADAGSTPAEQEPTTAPTADGETRTTDAGGPTQGSENDSRPQVTLRDANGTRLGTVTVMVADTGSERRTGLSDTTELNESEGMLFVYDSLQRDAAYVMRDMAFPLDIVFVAPNGTITTIHHAETEPGVANEDLTRYPGDGQYVLEVNRGYANRTGLGVGDTVEIPAEIATSDATPTPTAGGRE
jgi:uncharacterized membrane protein (UPF0127 family)